MPTTRRMSSPWTTSSTIRVSRHGDDKTQPSSQRDVDQVSDNIVHRPIGAQRRLLPLRVVEAGEVVDQRSALHVNQGPDIVRHAE